MDFTPTPQLTDATDLAATVFAGRSTPARLREVDQLPDRYDPELWKALGEAGLLGLAIPEPYDGAGLGVLELAGVLEQQGRHLGAVPLAHHLAAALAIARFGDDDLAAEWLPRAASGEVLMTVAGEGAALGAPHATAVVVLGQQLGFIADPEVEPQRLSTGESAGLVTGEMATLGDEAAVRWVRERLVVLQAALQLGVLEAGLALTAAYARTREQFGRPIGTFQAVSQRLADGYIDILGLRLTVQQAAWRLSEELPCATEVASAAMWAADAGNRIAHTTVHVHGGVGIDLDGEAHRYFTAAKQGEFLLGGTTRSALKIGRLLADA